MSDAIAPKGGTSQLDGTLIPYYSTAAYGLGYNDADPAESPNFSDGYGGLEWRNAVEIGATANGSQNSNVTYAIYSTRDKQGYGGTDEAVVWGLITDSDVSNNLLYLINHLPQMSPLTPHANFSDGIQWLISEGYFLANRNYPKIGFMNTPMAFAFDPTFMASYPWDDIYLYDLVGTTSAPGVLYGSVTPSVDLYNGNTPYLSVSQTPSNGFIALPDDIVSKLGNSQDYIIANLWFKINSPGDYTLLQVQDAFVTSKYWLGVTVSSTGILSVSADPRAQNDPGNPGFVAVKNGIMPGTFYCLTIQLDLTSDTLTVWCTAAADSFSTYSYSSPYTFGGGGVSQAKTPAASSIGANVTGTYSSVSYSGGGAEATFGSLHFYTGVAANSGLFNDTMAQKVFDETRTIYM